MMAEETRAEKLSAEQPDREKNLSFVEHLRELRKRIVNCAVATAIGFGFAYYYSDRLYNILALPLIQALPKGEEYMVFTNVVEPFIIYVKVGVFGGIILASPVILHQIWAFIAPGLLRHEKKWFLFLVFFSLVMFISGTLFAYFLVLPFAFKYLLTFSGPGLRPMVSMSLYFSMVTKLLIAFGVVFQMPLLILVLARFGIVTARQLISWWRYAIVLITIVAAILTPTPDIFSTLLMAGPLLVLYIVGIIVAVIFGKKRKKQAEETEE